MKTKSSRTLIFSAFAVSALVLTSILWMLSDADPNGTIDLSGTDPDPEGYLAGEHQRQGGLYPTDVIDPDRISEAGILEDVRSGRINLLAELRQLRSQCPRHFGEEYTPEQCRGLVLDFLNQLPEPDGGKLVQLFDDYVQYESKRANGELRLEPGMSLGDRYAAVREQRRNIFGEEDAQLIFGLEEANFDYQDLIRAASAGEGVFARGSVQQRLAAFEEQRGRIFGPYYETLLDREPAGAGYAVEMIVRGPELSQASPEEHARMVHSLRVKHFGEDGAESMRKSEAAAAAEFAEQNEKLEEFLAKEQAFIAEHPDMDPQERLAAIEKIRKDIMGVH